MPTPIQKSLAGIIGLDIRDFNEEMQFHKNIVDNNLNNGYQILFWKLIPYRCLLHTKCNSSTKGFRG